MSKATSHSKFVVPSDDDSFNAIRCLHQSALRSRDENDACVKKTLECEPGSAGSALKVEYVHAAAADAYVLQWNDLAGRCLEANVFMEPAFALPAVHHLRGGRPGFLFVWDRRNVGTPTSLIAICAPYLPGGLHFDLFARSWLNRQSTLGAPLLDRTRAIEAVDAILAWQKNAHPHLAGMIFQKAPLGGPTFAILSHRAALNGHYLHILDKHSRAVLRQTQDSPGLVKQVDDDSSVGPLEQSTLGALAPSRSKSLDKARRRLEREGGVKFSMSSDAQEAKSAFEEFLTLEAKGWKGRRGTALGAATDTATFARKMVDALARQGKCRIAKLDFDGRSIALGVLLISGANAFFWKIAYDEEFAQFSPGVQLSYELSQALLKDASIAFTDSCACADHPMIDRIWPEKMAVGDVLISSAANRRILRIALLTECLRRAARERLKELWNGLRRFVSSVRIKRLA